MNSKSMVIRMRKFLLLVESEKCNDLPRIQLKAKALRWDLEQMFKFPEGAVLTSDMHSDGQGDAAEIWTNEDESVEIERQIVEDSRR